MTDAVQWLNHRLAEAFEAEWDPLRPTRGEITRHDCRVGLKFFTRKRDGNWVLVHEEPAVELQNRTEAGDLLARGLSVFLMKHPGWPR